MGICIYTGALIWASNLTPILSQMILCSENTLSFQCLCKLLEISIKVKAVLIKLSLDSSDFIFDRKSS
ncbi:hypothetical protein VIBNIPon4_130133 [Vibrio nigripulchritudo POn4]|uniref:Uncharacterized protein n=1 Tax=Vibrio nigripulchritudo SOn1 TaxID=1238450 RepID=A0AAV2VND8_9VIBR|nr:hypothetical protein VIBNIPon4_130133 [Vibrio nigripulchritudo POn4]CCN71230.1 hypothetical protein VIBNISFn118_310012 [Vibrio nigripulchritudo SFn118]CCO45956.1 hypothetical protein VIBNISOn1_1610079 [Vibrio nigripulchritudo SOn1]